VNWKGNDVHVSDKASDTIHELRQILEREPVVSCELSKCRELVEHCDYSYGAAGDRLRSMLAGVTQLPPATKSLLFADAPHVTVSLPFTLCNCTCLCVYAS